MSIAHTQRKDRGVIATAAASLVITVGVLLFFLTGGGENEVSKSQYRKALLGVLHEDSQLVPPSTLSESEREFYDTCLVHGTYDRITARGKNIIGNDKTLRGLHKSDIGKLVTQSGECLDELPDWP